MRTLDDLVRQGKIRYAGFSNFSAWQMTYGLGVCDRLALNRPVVHQLGYNLVMRGIEADTLPACRHQGVDLTCYFPLNGGLLAGRETRERPIIGLQRFVEDKTAPKPHAEDQVRGAIGLEGLSEQWGYQPAHVALTWLLSRPGVASAIIGPESIAELEAALGYSQVKLDPGQLAQLDALCPPRDSWETLYGQSQPPALNA
jgi:aryl-alcohol dehydrogenase-like predicted oxidoreductase